MILWTIQDESLWAQLQERGELATDTERMIADQDSFWIWNKEPYEWLAEQMSKRVSPRPAPDAYPLWAWYQYHGARRKRPDLRCCAHVPKGTRAVRLEIELDPRDVLLSDFELWEVLLNGHYLERSRQEEREWERELIRRKIRHFRGGSGLPDDLCQRFYKSWELVFEVGRTDRYRKLRPEMRSIQATFWKLSLSQVRSVTHFIGR